MNIRAENRRQAYYEIQKDAPTRRWHVVQILRHHPEGMTAEEIVQELVADGIIKYFDMNYVRPRLTELARDGIVKACGKAISRRSGRSVTVWKTERAAASVSAPTTAKENISLRNIPFKPEKVKRE